MLSERGHGGSGGGGNGDGNSPRAQVALTAKQWSSLILAATHGVEALKASKSLPLGVISEALRDLGASLSEIQRALDVAAKRQAK